MRGKFWILCPARKRAWRGARLSFARCDESAIITDNFGQRGSRDVALREVRQCSSGRDYRVSEMRVPGEHAGGRAGGGRPRRGEKIFGYASGLWAPREIMVSGGARGFGVGGAVCRAALEERSRRNRNREAPFCFLR